MNTKSILSLIAIVLIVVSCGTKRHFVKNENGKVIDKRLVGVWKGNESGNLIEGMSSQWIMTRNLDGTFILAYKAELDGEIIEGTENGNWWIEDGLFYEYHDVSGGIDIYNYEVLNRKQIRFKAKEMAIDVVNKDYEFIDTKVTK